MASDVIGLFHEMDPENEEVLKFFKVPTRGMNQTRGRDEASKLMADPAKQEAWKNRPADAMQKEWMKLLGITIPRGLTHEQATALVAKREEELGEKDEKALDALNAQWAAYENTLEELKDPDTREVLGLKRVTFAVVRDAVDALHTEGKSWDDIYGDSDAVAEKILVMRPDLRRE
jgi:hypothetical protein